MDGMRNTALAALPPRWWQDVIEVPILLTAAFSFAKLLLIRCVLRLEKKKDYAGSDNTPNIMSFITKPPTIR